MKHVALAYTQHGKLHLDHGERHAMQDAVLTWPDGPATVTVERQHATRSTRANAYYWSVVVKAIAEYTGYTPDEAHEILKRQFLPKELAVTKANGKVIAEMVIGGSTAGLDSMEFYDYVERVRAWSFEELDIDMPPPDPEWREKVLAEKQKRHEVTP